MRPVKELAEEKDIKLVTAWQAIRRGSLKAQKQGRDWFTTETEFNRWNGSRRRGRKPRA